MLSQKIHQFEIERFHKKMENLANKIEVEPDKNKKAELALKYFELSELWIKIDNFIEYTVKAKLDTL
jgi:mRNA-degrading endonuclease YafQ of YafQ-DinJ toxin-antitoxin module